LRIVPAAACPAPELAAPTFAAAAAVAQGFLPGSACCLAPGSPAAVARSAYASAYVAAGVAVQPAAVGGY
jgi:hypothetical protein